MAEARFEWDPEKNRENMIRIFGAGYWRKGKKIYEKENHNGTTEAWTHCTSAKH
jgi:hypothetical protein